MGEETEGCEWAGFVISWKGVGDERILTCDKVVTMGTRAWEKRSRRDS